MYIRPSTLSEPGQHVKSKPMQRRGCLTNRYVQRPSTVSMFRTRPLCAMTQTPWCPCSRFHAALDEDTFAREVIRCASCHIAFLALLLAGLGSPSDATCFSFCFSACFPVCFHCVSHCVSPPLLSSSPLSMYPTSSCPFPSFLALAPCPSTSVFGLHVQSFSPALHKTDRCCRRYC